MATSMLGQTYINTEWAQATGQPSTVNWTASTLDASRDLIIVTNTLIGAGVSNVLITKYSSSGEELWQRTYAGSAALNDHGIAVTTDNSGSIYVAATVNNTSNDLDFALLKYSSDGDLIWDATWNGPSNLADVPAGLTLDIAGNIYLYGGSWTDPLYPDMALVKFTPSGSTAWAVTYDQANLLDAAIGMKLDEFGNPSVFGVSASNLLQWDVASLRYNGLNGAGMDTIVEVIPGIGGFQAKSFTFDDWGNIIVTGGRYNGSVTRMMTLKLSTDFSMLWSIEYPGDGFNDFGEEVITDAEGNVYITGYIGNNVGGKEYITLKYASEGTLLWNNVHKRHQSSAEATGKRLILNQDRLIVSGTALEDSQLSFATVGYSLAGEPLGVVNHRTPMSDNKVLSLTGGNNGDLYVSGASLGPNGNRYETVKYDVYFQDNEAVFDSTNNPLYMANEVIVKFRQHLVDTSIVDNKDWQHGTLSEIVSPSVAATIENKLGLPQGSAVRMKVVKVFPQLSRADSISISRLGEEVKMPKLWSTFMLISTAFGTEPDAVAQSLNSLSGSIAYAHANLLFKLSANDPVYAEGYQSSLIPNSEFPFADINIEPAWAIQVGQPFIKVGIIDTPVNWSHEDFVSDGQTKVVNGYEYFLNPGEVAPSLSEFSNIYPGGVGWHGTACASVVGALRNNEKGVAGIAGGDALNGNTGTAIVPLVIGTYFNYLPMNATANAILQGSADIPNGGYGFACDVLNMSWGASYPFGAQAFPYTMVEAILSANRNSCTMTAAHGNYGGTGSNFRAIPSAFASSPDTQNGIVADNVILSIGATGDDGEYLFQASMNTDGADINSCFGFGVDLTAPGSSSNVYTVLGGVEPGLNCQNLDPEIFGFTLNTRYSCFQGTSSAAPHVAGVAALMLAEHSVINGASNGLAPEDIEHILERSATDVFNLDIDTLPYSGFSVGYDNYHGNGRLNAGAALNLVADPYCVIHSGEPNATSTQQFATEVINIPYINLLELPSGPYTAYRVEVTHNYTDVFPIGAEIIEPNGSWARGSETIGTHAETFTINGRIWADYSFNIAGNVATVAATTNTWFIQAGVDNNLVVNSWYPAPPPQLRTAYSHLVLNADCWGPSTVSISEEVKEEGIHLFPNPAHDMLVVETKGLDGLGWELSMIDALGRNLSTQNIGSSVMTRIPITHLPSGSYCVVVRRGHDIHTRRFIKLH